MKVVAVFIVALQLAVGVEVDVRTTISGFVVTLDGITIMEQSEMSPMLAVGAGNRDVKEFRGNFHIKDEVVSRIPLRRSSVTKIDDTWQIVLQESGSSNEYQTIIELENDASSLFVTVTVQAQHPINRMWVRFKAEPSERVYGGGEQFSYLNLRGRAYPIWTREQGVGRNESTITTFFAHQREGAGGAYHTTYFPQPSFVSSRHYFCHLLESAPSAFDFSHEDYHEVEILKTEVGFKLASGSSIQETVEKLTGLLGRQPELPDWIYSGAILGVQGGTDKMISHLTDAQEAGVKVSGLWIQDWVGKKVTSFGSRLYWNWVWDEKWYPNLKTVMRDLKEKDIRVFAYINPHIINTGSLFNDADKKGYFIKNQEGTTYLQDFGEYFCGTVDFTNPEAYNWYKGVIKTNMIDLGFGGWMADFSEYTPVDGVFHSGIPGEEAHNLYPVLWAQCNREAVEEAGQLGEILYWMRSGFSGTGKHAVVMWAGDQNVDFSYSDGLPSAITGALSMGMSGMGLTHFDVGGYTTFPPMVRTPELFLRSAEAAIFTPVLRTHEGNMPQANWQFYSSPGTMCRFARLTQLFTTLRPYMKEAVRQNAESGTPVQRPLFFNYENDPVTLDIQYQYMLGDDLLVAPVHQPQQTSWSLYLPDDDWVFVWDGKNYKGLSDVTVDAPIGKPPAFYRKGSKWTPLFEKLSGIMASCGDETIPPHIPLDQKIVQLVMSQVAPSSSQNQEVKDEL